jgi:hypothetical protein
MLVGNSYSSKGEAGFRPAMPRAQGNTAAGQRWKSALDGGELRGGLVYGLSLGGKVGVCTRTPTPEVVLPRKTGQPV